MTGKFVGDFTVQHLILCMGKANTGLLHKTRKEIQVKPWNNYFSVELFSQIHYMFGSVWLFPPP